MPEKTNSEPEDNRSFEEKFKDFVEKIKPYKERLWAVRKKFLIVNLIVLILAVAYLFFLAKPYFESTVTILPEYGNKSSMLSQLSGLASIAGVNVGEAAPTEIYQNIITSESVIAPVIYAKYKTEEFPDSVNLIQYFEVKDQIKTLHSRREKIFLSFIRN